MKDTRRTGSALLLAATLLGCSGSTTSPAAVPDPDPTPAPTDEITRTATDPTGDVFGGTGWDLTGLTITRDTAGITVRLDLSTNVISPVTNPTTGLIGFVDFDTDQNAATGITSTADEYRPGTGATGIKADYQLTLTDYDASGKVPVTDAQGHEMGRVTPEFSAQHVTIRIPRALLGGDDGYLNAAATVGAGNRPSDIVPENGHLTVGP